MEIPEVVVSSLVAGGLGLAGVALTVWAQDRRERNRGWQDLESSKRRLELMTQWLDVHDRLGARELRVDLPTTLATDLREAYDVAHRGAGGLAEHGHVPFWPRVRAAALPPKGPLAGWARVWRTVYYAYAVLAGLFVAFLSLGLNGTVPSFGEAVATVAIVILVAVAGPLTLFRVLSLHAHGRAATKRGDARPGSAPVSRPGAGSGAERRRGNVRPSEPAGPYGPYPVIPGRPAEGAGAAHHGSPDPSPRRAPAEGSTGTR
ncbi:hypothetical protein [Cellulomonas sp. URHB0016]